MHEQKSASSKAEKPFIITLTWLRKHATRGAGWSRRQLEALGLPYPARAGWMQRTAGKRISQEQRSAFEAAAKTATGMGSAPRNTTSPAGGDDAAQLGAYVRGFAALARCDACTTTFMHWIADSLERLTAGSMSRAERQALVTEAARYVQAMLAATAGESRVTS
jgi:hypothetical protein